MQTENTLIVKDTPENISLAAATLQEGRLVSFPTETVYGLGANALNAEACNLIFTTKGRPLTDPLIVHVHSVEQALELIDTSDVEVVIMFRELAHKFWPGPLTIVTKANLDKIPMLVTAQTGSVGIRIPNNPTALSLLRESGLPIAAPSANKFGHVSPTQALHVFKDFEKSQPGVLILDGGNCSFGIESTVAKLSVVRKDSSHSYCLEIIRKGGTSLEDLEEKMSTSGSPVEIKQLAANHSKEETEHLEAPG